MDVGKAGENYFSFLCNTSKIISNRSLDSDFHGWDHYIQFPSSELMLSEPLITAQVQVKSTMNAKNTIQMDFQNLLKLSTHRYPSFIVYLKFNQAELAPEEIYIKHLDEKLINTIFQKISKIHTKKGAVNLKKHQMTVHFLENERLTDVRGTGLKTRFKDLIGISVDRYLENKISYLNFLKQKYSATTLSFNVKGVDLDEIQDAFLGVGNPISIHDLSVIELDLGLEISRDKNNYKNVEIIALPDKENNEFRTLSFSGNIGFPDIELECLFIASPINGFVANEDVKVRYSHHLFDILLKPFINKFTIHFKFLEGDLIDINELYKVLYIAKHFGNPERIKKMTISHHGKSVDFTLPECINNIKVDDILTCLENFRYMQRHMKSFDERLKISIPEIMGVSEKITHIRHLLDKSMWLRFEFYCEGINTSLRIATLICMTLTLSGRCYCFVLVIIGEAEDIGEGRFRITSKDISLVDSFVIKEKFTREELLPLLARYEGDYSKNYFVIKQDSYLF